MSRSYKKYAGYKDRSPWYKNYANRRLRRIPVTEEPIGDHKSYRKYSNPWDICDFAWHYYSFEEFREQELKWYKFYEDLGINHKIRNYNPTGEFEKSVRAAYARNKSK
jgi:hypothetical protein